MNPATKLFLIMVIIAFTIAVISMLFFVITGDRGSIGEFIGTVFALTIFNFLILGIPAALYVKLSSSYQNKCLNYWDSKIRAIERLIEEEPDEVQKQYIKFHMLNDARSNYMYYYKELFNNAYDKNND